MTICDRIAVMDQGVIQQIGTPLELYDHPVNRFVAQFVGSVNLFEGGIASRAGRWIFTSAELGEWVVPERLAPGGAAHVELAFRPHAVELETWAAPAAPCTDVSLQLDGEIENGEFLGEFMRYQVRVHRALVTADQPHLRGMCRFDNGVRVRLSVPPAEIRLIQPQ
jgi:iron(III) transport system ATP-binding protein